MDNTVEGKFPPARTKAGEAWVKSYSHPPSGNEGVEGLPDQSVQSSIVAGFRNEFSIDPPTAVGTGTWSCLLIGLPNVQYPLAVLKWVGDLPTATSGVSVQTLQNPNFNWGSNAFIWEDTVAQFRFLNSSTTVYFDASDLYNQGKCYTAQASFSDVATVGALTVGSQLGEYLNVGIYPATASQILQLSDKPYSGMAKDGSYSVEGFSNPVMNYRSANPTVSSISGDMPIVTGVTSLQIPMGGTDKDAPFYTEFTNSYHLYKGLLAQATLQVKRCFAIEALPMPGSAWVPFIKRGPMPDAPALELAACLRHSGADGYPSAANDLGAFLGAAKSLLPVLGQVWKIARPALRTGLNTLPSGGLINQLVDGVETMVNARTPAPRKLGTVGQQVVQQAPVAKAKRKPKPKKKRSQKLDLR